MHRFRYNYKALCLSALVICILLLFADSAFAAVSIDSYASGSGGSTDTLTMLKKGIGVTGFDKILGDMGPELIRSARYIVAILIAASGIMVAFGIEDGKKTMWSVILGLGLALNLGSFLLTSYGSYWNASPESNPVGQIEVPVITSGSDKKDEKQTAIDAAGTMAEGQTYSSLMSIKSGDAFKNGGFQFFRSFLTSYVDKIIIPGALNLRGLLIKLSLAITLIDASLKLSLDLVGGNVVKFLITLSLKLGFNIFLITEWLSDAKSKGLALTQNLCNGFAELGFKAAGINISVDNYVFSGLADGIIKAALVAWNALYAKSSNLSIFEGVVLTLFCIFALIIFMISMIWIAFEIVMAQVEFYTMALLTMMLLPFMMSEHTSFLSRNAISAMFNCAIKVCVIAFLAAAGTSAVGNFFDAISSEFSSSKNGNLISLYIQLNMTVCFFLFMVLKIPSLVSGLLTGNPSMGASDMVNSIRSGAAMAMGAASSGLTTGLSAVGAVRGAYAAQGGGDSGGGGGGNNRMSSLNNIGGGSADAAGMAAEMGPSGGGSSSMSASTGGSSAAMSNVGGGSSGGSGSPSTDAPVETGGGSSGGSSSGSSSSKLAKFGKAVATAGRNAAVAAVFNSKPAQAYRNGYSIGQSAYQTQSAGAVKKNWETGEEVDANGQSVPSPTLAMAEQMNNIQSSLNEISSKLTPPPAPPPDVGTFNPKG